MYKTNDTFKSLIFIPYASIDNAAIGVNISDKRNSVNTYLKNACVALVSAKHYNPLCDVALVTNIGIPEPYKSLLSSKGILIINIPFDCFYMGAEYKWSLAFYKLCALKHIAFQAKYDYICYMDTDVYIQSSFEHIWTECDENILLYDINHGLQVKDYTRFINELKSFGIDKKITHYGGEFFAANKENARRFAEASLHLYNEISNKNFITTMGDEFILSVVADQNKTIVKNAGAYIFRFWTISFYLVSTQYKYNPVVILHVPNEKEDGIIKIYDKYVKNGSLPKKNKVHKMLHLCGQSTRVKFGIIKTTILKLIYKFFLNKEEQMYGNKA